MWKEQKQRVDNLCLRARDRASEAYRLKAGIRAWKRDVAGSAGMLAWAFGAGAWWAASRPSPRNHGSPGLMSVLVKTSNLLHLALGVVDLASRNRR